MQAIISIQQTAMKPVCWKYEGAPFCSGGNVTINREYNPNAKAGAHNYTTSETEHNRLVKLGWRGENSSFKAAELPDSDQNTYGNPHPVVCKNQGDAGNISIPKLFINCAMYSSWSQAVVDHENAGDVLTDDHGTTFICDHVTQDFLYLDKAKGQKVYWSKGDTVETYTCTNVYVGRRNGSEIYLHDGTPSYAIDADALMYTCRDYVGGVTVAALKR